MPAPQIFECYTVTAPGVEGLTAGELRALGLSVGPQEPGGVSFTGDIRDIQRANLHLRTASRVLVRMGEFHASEFYQLEKRARKLPWETFLSPGDPIEFRVTSRTSRLYHQRGIAERLANVAREQVAGVELQPPGGQRFVVRLVHDRCLVSADSSGDNLHRRGYRGPAGKAPLRETLAAAMLLAIGWDGARPMLDPFCGSGTIPIEAALLAGGIPPGLHRSFRFEGWPGHDGLAWRRLVAEARAHLQPVSLPPIHGSDRDAGAVAAALENAERAGVAGVVTFARVALSAVRPPPTPGFVVSNPPYGVRVGQGRDLRDLYDRLGDWARACGEGWQIGLLAADASLIQRTRLPLEAAFATTNGGIKVRFYRTAVGG